MSSTQSIEQILSWSPMVRKDKLRTFCPIVLFHEHTYKNDNSVEKCVKIQTGDEHHGEFIRNWKKRVDEMLQSNSRDWMIIAENSKYEKRLLCNHDEYTQSAILANSIYSHHPLHPNSQDQIDLAMKPKRRRGNLPKAVTALLKDWLAKHKKHPYPTEEEKLLLAKETKLSLQQISNWFINARRRHLPHLLESDTLTINNQTAPELDIFPYEASESADNSDNRLRCSSRINNKTGGVKKPKPYNLQHKRKAVVSAA